MLFRSDPAHNQQHQRGTEHDRSGDPSGRGLRVLYDIEECHAESHEYESQNNIALPAPLDEDRSFLIRGLAAANLAHPGIVLPRSRDSRR